MVVFLGNQILFYFCANFDVFILSFYFVDFTVDWFLLLFKDLFQDSATLLLTLELLLLWMHLNPLQNFLLL